MIECVFILSRLRECPGLMNEIEQWVGDNTDAGWSRGKSFINGAVFRASVMFACDRDAVAFMLRYSDVVAYTQPADLRMRSKD